MTTSIARGKRAREALAQWTLDSQQRLHRRIRSYRPSDQDGFVTAYGRSAAPVEIRVGEAVWYRAPLAKAPGETVLLRCHVKGQDALTGRLLLIDVDRPRNQFYAPRCAVTRRYAGEMAPGRSGRR